MDTYPRARSAYIEIGPSLITQPSQPPLEATRGKTNLTPCDGKLNRMTEEGETKGCLTGIGWKSVVWRSFTFLSFFGFEVTCFTLYPCDLLLTGFKVGWTKLIPHTEKKQNKRFSLLPFHISYNGADASRTIQPASPDGKIHCPWFSVDSSVCRMPTPLFLLDSEQSAWSSLPATMPTDLVCNNVKHVRGLQPEMSPPQLPRLE